LDLLLRNFSQLSCRFFPSLRSWYSAWHFLLQFLQQCSSVRVVTLVSHLHNTRKLSHRRTGFVARQVNVGFVVGKVTLGQLFLRVPPFSPPVGIIPASPHNNILPIHQRQNALLANFTVSFRTRNIES